MKFQLRFLLFLLLFSPLAAFAQFTTVTATITDQSGNPYANCAYNIDFVNNTGISQLPLLAGAPFQTSYGGSCSSSATMTARIPDTAVITPAGTQWKFSICDTTGKSCFQYTTPACPTAGCITGTSIDISTALKAVSAPLGSPILPGSVGGSLTPAITNTYNLGSPSAIWANGYFTNLPGNMTLPGTNAFTGSDTFSKFNKYVYLDGTKYAFSAAGIQAAHDGADCPSSGCNIDIGPNAFNLTAGVTFTKPVCLISAGVPATILNYTPATGIAFNFSPSGFRACFMGVQLTTSTSTSSVGVQFTAVSEGIIFNSMIHGFFGGIRATGDGVSQNSTGIRIAQVLVDFNCGSGGYDLSLDHAQDVFLDAFRFYQTGGGAGACGTSIGLIIDRSAQGIWMRDGTIENGLHAAVIQNTNLGGNWGGVPGAIFATSVTFDNALGGTDLLFDASLGTGPLRFYCNGCWFAGAGVGASPVTTAMGFDVEGGSDINFVGGVCRFNESWCGKINSGGSAFEVTEMQVYDNNQGNTAGVGGFLITASPANWSIKNLPSCGNKGIDTTGHQHYCVDYSAAAAGSGTAFGNNTTNNIDGPNNIGAAVTTGFSAPYFYVDDIFPAATGGVRLSEAKAQVKSKNHAVNGDIILVAKSGANDTVQLGDTAGSFMPGPLASTGTPPTIAGTGACVTFNTQLGGTFVGSAKCTGATGAATVTITFSVTQTNGYDCTVQNETTRANLLQQTAHTTNSCTLTATSITQNDVFVFNGLGF